MATLLRHFRGTSHNGAEPVEKIIPPRTDTNTGTVTGGHHGPDIPGSTSQDQQTASGPTDQEEKGPTEDDDLAKDNMTSITSFQVSQDLMEQTPFHNYTIHEDKFEPAAFATNSNSYEFPTFPDAPPLAGNPLFDEKEAAFMSSFFDTVDQNTSFDHEFQDGLAQWTVPGLDIRKGFEDVWSNQPNVTNGTNTNNNYSANSVFSMTHYEQASPSEPTYAATPYPKNQNVAILHTQPQQYNPSPQNFLSHLHNPNHNPNDLARTVFTHRHSHPTPSQCDPLFSSYPSLNIPAASPSAIPPSAAQTPNSTPKPPNYSFLKHEISSSESPPPVSSIPRLSLPRGPPSTYAPSSASSSSPQPNGKPPRKKRRENLSDQQKRLNHITSEQKRRNLIQEGFNEIHSLVPTLRGQRERGDSKSTVLLKTVDYIRELREGNERLRRMLNR